MGPFDTATPFANRTASPATRAQMAHAQTLEGWIALLAEDRGLCERAVAAKTGLAVDDCRAILTGVGSLLPLHTLDRALRQLEGRSH